jgi:serine protease Do
MKKIWFWGTILATIAMLAGVGITRSQQPPAPPSTAPAPEAPAPPQAILAQDPPEAPEAPEPPEPPEPPEAPDNGENITILGLGGPRLGVMLKDVTDESVKEHKLPGEFGAIITEVEPDSPAAKAGLQKGDVILQFAGERVRSVAELRRMVRETPSGRAVTLEISRDGKVQDLSAKLEGHKDQFSWVAPKLEIPHVDMPNFTFYLHTDGPRLGISGDDLTKQLATYFGVKQGKGVLVREVMVGSAAERAGVKAGDVIVAVDSKSIGNVGQLRDALGSAADKDSKQVSVMIVRDRHEQTLTVQLEKPVIHRQGEVSGLEFSLPNAEAIARFQNEAKRSAEQYQKQAAELARQVQIAVRAQQNETQRAWQQKAKEEARQIQELLRQEQRAQRLSTAASSGNAI